MHDQGFLCFCIGTALDIERCDLNIKDNHSNHHTELFGEERLIVRRGQPFSIALHLSPSSKEFKVGKTNFMFDVETGTHLLQPYTQFFYIDLYQFYTAIYICFCRSITRKRI